MNLPNNYHRDHIGTTVGALTIISFAFYRKKQSYWNFICKCGNIRQYVLHYAKLKASNECTCNKPHVIRRDKLRRRPATIKQKNLKERALFDGIAMSRTKTYSVFKGMKDRCYNKNNSNYKWYGGRGIGICEQWLADPASFCEWAKKNGYAEGLLIDRIDWNKGYSPDNCRFVDAKTSSRNTSKNIHATLYGEKRLFIEWCEILGIDYSSTYQRYMYLNSFPPEMAIKISLGEKVLKEFLHPSAITSNN